MKNSEKFWTSILAIVLIIIGIINLDLLFLIMIFGSIIFIPFYFAHILVYDKVKHSIWMFFVPGIYFFLLGELIFYLYKKIKALITYFNNKLDNK